MDDVDGRTGIKWEGPIEEKKAREGRKCMKRGIKGVGGEKGGRMINGHFYEIIYVRGEKWVREKGRKNEDKTYLEKRETESIKSMMYGAKGKAGPREDWETDYLCLE